MLTLLVAVFCISAALTGCNNSPNTVTPEEPQEPQTSVQPEKSNEPQATQDVDQKEVVYKESPYFEGKDLPPVKERLPEKPKISNEMPEDQLKYEIGKYGGTIRVVRNNPVWDAAINLSNCEPLINSPGLMANEITPNVAEKFEVSEDQKEFTFYLRKGLKWSDGEPVTMDDVKFAFEDVLLNEQLSPAGFPVWLKSGAKSDGTPAVLEVVDDYTFKLKFDEPYGGFLLQASIISWRNYNEILKPKHYLQKFHKKYTSMEELETLILEAGFQPEEWNNLFNQKDILHPEKIQPDAVDFPVLSPWVTRKTGDICELERNPYYFKIDAEGNQLPYIDKIQSTLVPDMEMVQMKIVSGEVDFSTEWGIMSKVPLYIENESKNGTKVMTGVKIHRTTNDIYLNLTYDDPVWREVVRNVQFRKALNLALNKEEIADSVYYGYAKPAYDIYGAEFNLDEANKILDEMGMKKGTDGYRIGPDGKKFTIPIEYAAYTTDHPPTIELVVEQWKQLGIETTAKQTDSTLNGQRNAANELQCSTLWCHGPVLRIWNDWSLPIFGPLWDRWYNSNGKEGEEPPEEVKNFIIMSNEIYQLSVDEANKRAQEILSDLGQNCWFFILTRDVTMPVVLNSKLSNYPDAGYAIANNFAAEQWFFKE